MLVCYPSGVLPVSAEELAILEPQLRERYGVSGPFINVQRNDAGDILTFEIGLPEAEGEG